MSPSGRSWAWFSIEVKEEKREEEQPTGSATDEGANQVPSPVTPTDWQGNNLNEIWMMLLVLMLTGCQCISDLLPAPVAGCGADGGASQNRNEKNGDKEGEASQCVMLNGSSWSTEEKGYFGRKRSGAGCFCGIEHRLIGETTDREWSTCAKKGYIIAAGDACSTKRGGDQEA